MTIGAHYLEVSEAIAPGGRHWQALAYCACGWTAAAATVSGATELALEHHKTARTEPERRQSGTSSDGQEPPEPPG